MNTHKTPLHGRDLLLMVGSVPNKAWGQNFLQDNSIIQKVIDECQGFDSILEIGSGLGALTIPLIEKTKGHLLVVEIDPKLARFIAFKVPESRKDEIQIVNNDFLKVNLQDYVFHDGCVVSSLPYNAGSPILHRLIIDYFDLWKKGTFVLQKEVIDKITAQVPKATYWSQFFTCYYDIRVLMRTIPATAFYPQPKVDSSIIVLNKRDPKTLASPKEWSEFLHLIFKSPRKIVRSSISKYSNFPEELLKKRPGELTLEELNFIYSQIIGSTIR